METENRLSERRHSLSRGRRKRQIVRRITLGGGAAVLIVLAVFCFRGSGEEGFSRRRSGITGPMISGIPPSRWKGPSWMCSF